jgi:hypothetical protein
MRVMALYTISFHNNLMAAFGIFRDDSFVALEADLIRIFRQQFAMGRGMGVMTFRAFS